MASLTHIPSLLLLGEAGPAGVYLLRLHLLRPVALSLGKLQQGRIFHFAPGPYLYGGSALGQRGAASLGRRLLRHATRCSGPAHPLQRRLRRAFPAIPPPATKRLHWHVDYLLEQPAALLTGALVLRTARPLESAVASWLIHRPYVHIPASGAGASDTPDRAHDLAVGPFAGWWAHLCRAAIYGFVEER